VKTEIVTAVYDRRLNRNALATARAVEHLQRGEPVALPTETVYGLAADALDAEAVTKIFEAKERPRFDPLIVHLPDRDWLKKIVDVRGESRHLIERLMNHFWPGPFTIVLPKREIVPDIVTAGLDTVAVRISAHPVFGEIIRAFGKPLAAPSANRFGRISPTTAQHVRDELDGRISLIVDAGPTAHGLESTIVSVGERKIDILRQGPITAEQLSRFAKVNIIAAAKEISAPGQLPTHYAPKTPLRLIDVAESFSPEKNQRVGLLAWNPRKRDLQIAQGRTGDRPSLFVAIRDLSVHQDFREAATNLFRYLRELDALNLDLIVAEQVPEKGLGAAIMDRLKRAQRKAEKRCEDASHS
jgi:L-threonylcarbamoyladenylate synthase